MIRIAAILSAAALFGCGESGGQATATFRARAEMIDANGRPCGEARLVEEPGKPGVEIRIEVRGLSEGSHGFHIHENAACHAPGFESAGGHFNPGGKKHGLQNPEGPHAGDLPNLVAGTDGRATAVVRAPGATLSAGPRSLLKPGGTCLVVHELPDDGKSDPAGDAGSRVACGVIVRAD